MKTILLFTILLIACPVWAQKTKSDTTKGEFKQIYLQEKREKRKANPTEILSDPLHRHSYQNNNFLYFKGHWSGFFFGFINFDNTTYIQLGETAYMELDKGNSWVMQFNLIQKGIRLNPSNTIGLVTGLGLEYQRFRFKHKNTIVKDEHGVIHDDPLTDLHVKKSSFKNLYLTIPLLVEVQFPGKSRTKAFVSGGFTGGLRLHTKTKVVYKKEDGKKRRLKDSGNFSMTPVKVDATLRAGYGHLAVWGNYSLNRMFKTNKGPELHPYSIGIGITF